MTEQEEDQQTTETEGVMHGYRVIFEEGRTSWGAYAPDLPGLGVAGHSRAEVERLIDEGIPIYVDALREDRLQRPWLYRPEDLSSEMAAVFARIDAA